MTQPFTTTTDFLAGGGEMATLIRAFDWSETPLGPIEQWPQSLKTATNLMLNARQPMWIGWGPAVTFLYNDAYIPVLSLAKHPQALGKPTAVVWEEIWDFCGPLSDKVFQLGEASFVDDVRLFMSRGDHLEETFYSFSYSPIRDETGQVTGLFCPNVEVTAQNINTRRLATLSALATNTLVEKTTRSACASVATTLRQNPDDIPFALLYLSSADRKQMVLEEAIGLVAGDTRLSPKQVAMDGLSTGPLNLPIAQAMQQSKMLEGTWSDSAGLPTGPAEQVVNQAVVLPLIASGQERPIGVLVAGVNPTRRLDPDYRTFYELIANQVATAIQNAHTAEEERHRLDQLAELNRTKTLFFNNISHEFRTPLTLMLGPLDELLRGSDGALNQGQRSHAQAAHRNAERLLRLVNTLLDFSRLESGRLQPTFTLTDLPTLTRDLASSFRSVIEKAGMQLVVETGPFVDPVAVDCSMWEKIVLNLLSNAFKFTFTGTITVQLIQQSDDLTLTVQDTGVGIPETDLPRLFERFHRVEGSPGRSMEGTGIGLSLVQELVQLHGGTIQVSSELGKGSTFTIRMPIHQDQPVNAPSSDTSNADLYLADANLMLQPEPSADSPLLTIGSEQSGMARQRIVLADDNADMRAYIHRLLSPHYIVEAVADGQEALTAIQRNPPDLVLSDIMMPRLDGAGLLKALKSAPETAYIPIMLLSARADEESALSGYAAGANDYLTKPFSANELLVRVESQLKLAQARQENQQKLRHLFKQAPIAIAILEGPKHVFTLANDRYLRLVDRSYDGNLIGLSFLDAFPELISQGFGTKLDHIYQTGESFSITEQAIDLIHDDHSATGYFNYSFEALTDPAGLISGIIVVAKDVTNSVLARQKLETSERELQNLFEQAPVVLSIVGREPDFIYRMANAAFAQLIDRPINAIVGKPLLDVLPEIKGQGFDDLLKQVMNTGVPYVAREAPVGITRQGVLESLYFDYMYYPLRELSGEITGVMGVVIDVTQQVKARQQIEASRQQFQQLADLVPQILWTALPDGTVDYFNEPWYEFTGLTKTNGSQTWLPVIHPDDAERTSERWFHSVQTGEPYQVEYRFADRYNPGHYRWFIGRAVPVRDETGTITKWFGTCTDIDEHKQAEIALKESESRFRAIADTAPVFIWISGTDKLCTFFNKEWLKFTGRTMEQELGNGWTEGVHPDDWERCLSIYTTAFDNRQDFYMEYRLRRHDGEYRWISDDGRPRFAPDGTFVGYIGGCVDVHERKLANEELERRVAERTRELHKLNTDLERSNFDLMQFASVASHDLKEPLRKIQAFSNLLTSSLTDKLTKEEEQHFSRITRAAARMQTLVDDVLRLSKLSKLDAQYEPVNLNAVIAQIQDDLEITIREKNAVILVEPLPTIEAVEGQMHQLFQNLISNALKFVSNRLPKVTIETELLSDTMRTQFNLGDQNYIVICVRDNGIGFDMQYVEKIFGMFQRLHRRDQYDGTGIGLTICRRIVENHHGYLIAEGKPGEGATFQIILPVSQQAFTIAN
jgi:PAS domain S-box-containing protein